jgi:hypothetical protein
MVMNKGEGAGLFFKGVVAHVKYERTKKGKEFVVVKSFINNAGSCYIFTFKDFNGNSYVEGEEVTVPVFVSSRIYNDRVYTDYIVSKN